MLTTRISKLGCILSSSLFALSFFLLLACDTALDPAAPLKKVECASCPEAKKCEKCEVCPKVEKEEEKDAKLDGFQKYWANVVASENLSADEKHSVDWMVTVLSNKDIYKTFVKLCSEDSPERDFQACIKAARSELRSLYMMSSEQGRRNFRFLRE